MSDFIGYPELISAVRSEVRTLFDMFLADEVLIALGIDHSGIGSLRKEVYAHALHDLIALLEKDPAAANSEPNVIAKRPAYRAIIGYRLAHAIQELDVIEQELKRDLALDIFHKIILPTKVEIHPEATIGKRFVIDHGSETVIGQTACIGDDCYLTQGVILGSRGIADNPNTKRHPTIGHRVEIGGCSRILGDVNIGNDVFIAPYAVIDHDVPDNTRVIIVNQLQLTRTNHKSVIIHGVVPNIDNSLAIYGTGLNNVESCELMQPDGKDPTNIPIAQGLAVIIEDAREHVITLRFERSESDTPNCCESLNLANASQLALRLNFDEGNLIITNSTGLRHALTNLTP